MLRYASLQIPRFEAAHYHARYESTAPYMLSASACEPTSVSELLELAGVSADELGAVSLSYTETGGHPELRRAIASGESNVDADDVIVLNSPVEGIFVAMSALLAQGDRAVVLAPCYEALRNIPEHLCGNVEMWTMQGTDEGWALDMDALDELLEPPTKVLVVNFPNNPTGFLPTPDEYAAILEHTRKRGVWLFSDEIYRGLEPEGTPPLPTAAELYERAVVVDGLSKSYGLPGLRCGWVVARDVGLRDRITNWMHYTSQCQPAPVELLALAALDARDALLKRNRARVAENLKLGKAFFDRWNELFHWRAPIAGPVALVGIDVPSATEYCHTLAKDAGVVLLPSSFLGYDDGHVRFGFGQDDFGSRLARYEAYLENKA